MSTTFYALEGLLVDHADGMMHAEISTLGGGADVQIVLTDDDGDELVSGSGKTITEALEDLEKQAQMFLDDYE